MVDCRGGLLDFIADMHSLIRVRQHHRQDGRCIDFDKIDFYDCCGGLLDFIADMHSLIRVRQHPLFLEIQSRLTRNVTVLYRLLTERVILRVNLDWISRSMSQDGRPMSVSSFVVNVDS
jgi:hypothetical protein